jgi:hypothetical protein
MEEKELIEMALDVADDLGGHPETWFSGKPAVPYEGMTQTTANELQRVMLTVLEEMWKCACGRPAMASSNGNPVCMECMGKSIAETLHKTVN